RERDPATAALGRLSRVGGARRAVGRSAGARARPRTLVAHAHAGRRRARGRRVVADAATTVTDIDHLGFLFEGGRHVRALVVCVVVVLWSSAAAFAQPSSPLLT